MMFRLSSSRPLRMDFRPPALGNATVFLARMFSPVSKDVQTMATNLRAPWMSCLVLWPPWV